MTPWTRSSRRPAWAGVALARFDDADAPPEIWTATGPEPASPGRAAAGRRVVVLLPARRVLLARVPLPTRDPVRARAAAAFALEELLLQEPEQVAVALGRPAGDAWPVAVVDRALLEAVLARLQALGLAPVSIRPEMLALPWRAGEATLWAGASGVLVRSAGDAGAAFPADGLAQACALVAAGRPADATRIAVGAEDPARLAHAAVEARRAGLEVASTRVVPLGAWLFEGLGAPPGIDFLPPAAVDPRWRRVAIVGALAVALGATGEWLDQRRLQAEIAAFEVATEAALRAAGRPDAPREAAALARLADRTSTSGDLLGLLAEGATALPPSVDVLGLEYHAGRLELTVAAPDLRPVDAAVRQLDGEPALRAELADARLDGERWRGRLSLEAGR